jgi:urease gamma subunit
MVQDVSRAGTKLRCLLLVLHADMPRKREEDKVKLRSIAAAALIAACVAPAFAADEYYVVQDVKTKRCTVVDKKPADTTTTVVSPSGTVYKSRSEAETGMKSVKVCTSN